MSHEEHAVTERDKAKLTMYYRIFFVLLVLMTGARTLKAQGFADVSSVTTLASSSPLPATSVEFSDGVLADIAFLYRNITSAEFVLCLEGEITDRMTVRVDGFRLAHIRYTTQTSVEYNRCDIPRYVGTAHNHPQIAGWGDESLCLPSDLDVQSFWEDSAALIDVIFCGERSFRWLNRSGGQGGTPAPGAPGAAH